MKIPTLPFTVTDWSQVAATTHPGETGKALWRTLDIGDLRVRMVEYSAGYLADHWCDRGHVLYVLQGELDTELRDGRTFKLLGHWTSVELVEDRFVRWASPLTHTLRTAMEDIEIGGVQIKEGDWVVPWFIAANRDEAVFENANTFDAGLLLQRAIPIALRAAKPGTEGWIALPTGPLADLVAPARTRTKS